MNCVFQFMQLSAQFIKIMGNYNVIDEYHSLTILEFIFMRSGQISTNSTFVEVGGIIRIT